jgi:hypothetical protein
MVSMLLTKALLVVGLYKLQVLREAQGSTETRRPGHCFLMGVYKRMIFVDIMPCGQTITSDLQIKTLTTLQTCLMRVRFYKKFAAVLLQHNARSHANLKTE